MSDYKRWISGVFDRAAPEYGKKSASFFNYFGKRLVEQVDVAPGQHALDVATGRGAVLFSLAEVIGPLGKVVGIDISQQMIQETTKDAIEKNMQWVDLQCMDAEHIHFPDNYFDFVFCGFALFFLPSIPTALSEFKRVLKKGGKLAVSIWGKESELKAWVNDEIKKLCNTTNLFATPLWSAGELRKVLEEAYFKDIQIVEETKVFSHKTPEEWWDSFWTHGTRAKLEQLSSDQIATLRDKVIKKASDLGTGQGITEALQVYYGIVQKS